MKNKNIKDLGQKFVDYLHDTDIKLTEENDGRLESLNSENDITDSLRKKFKDVNFLENQLHLVE